MALNNKLDRRHDINAGERLPERHTRVQDEELYRDNIGAVLENEASEAFQKALQEKREKEHQELLRKKAAVKPGTVVALKWGGITFRKVDDAHESGVKLGPTWYGWECIEVPSENLVNQIGYEVGAI